MSKEEEQVWLSFSAANVDRYLWSMRPLSLTEWAQQGIVNPAPLIEWFERHKRGEFRK